MTNPTKLQRAQTLADAVRAYAKKWEGPGRAMGDYANLLELAEAYEAAPDPEPDAFKAFHKRLCERFGYVHDEKDWRRDLLSLEEHIAKRHAATEQGPEPAHPGVLKAADGLMELLQGDWMREGSDLLKKLAGSATQDDGVDPEATWIELGQDDWRAFRRFTAALSFAMDNKQTCETGGYVIRKPLDEDHRQCAICGFVVDLAKGHVKPEIDFGTRGRSEHAPKLSAPNDSERLDWLAEDSFLRIKDVQTRLPISGYPTKYANDHVRAAFDAAMQAERATREARP